MADTLSAQIAAATQEIINASLALMPQNAPLMNLVTRKNIPKGNKSLQIPRQNTTTTVEQPTEGDDLASSSQFSLTSTTIVPTLRAIKYRISMMAEQFSKEDLIKLISEEIARAQGQDIDTDISAEFANFGAGNNVGTSNVDLTLAVLRKARRLLKANTVANGGPAPDPIVLVLAPIPEEDLYTNIGVQGAVASTSPWIPAGLSQEVIQQYGLPDNNQLVGVKMFWDGYLTEDGSGDFTCAMFSKLALWYAVSRDWDMQTFTVPNFIGTILRSVALFNSGVGAYPLWGSKVLADGS